MGLRLVHEWSAVMRSDRANHARSLFGVVCALCSATETTREGGVRIADTGRPSDKARQQRVAPGGLINERVRCSQEYCN